MAGHWSWNKQATSSYNCYCNLNTTGRGHWETTLLNMILIVNLGAVAEKTWICGFVKFSNPFRCLHRFSVDSVASLIVEHIAFVFPLSVLLGASADYYFFRINCKMFTWSFRHGNLAILTVPSLFSLNLNLEWKRMNTWRFSIWQLPKCYPQVAPRLDRWSNVIKL